jgi:hypothetical protein
MGTPTAGEQMVVDEAPDDLAHGPSVGPHRFTMFNKGEHYAYARGLEVSPQHLPRALDAMLADGWKLVSLFGQTDAKHVGFIFEWVGPNKRVNELLAANTGLVLQNRSLRNWIKNAIEQFRFYGQSHRAKGTEDATAKAVVNEGWVESGEATLAE